ncbi:hypothetical protein ACFV8Z_52825 [Streptomyces sp. NPDC059837]|uniref:hypothetical protein n=1 Tax=unclassified Streptomyces TaxID=2593676 RepID=UPI003651EA9E
MSTLALLVVVLLVLVVGLVVAAVVYAVRRRPSLHAPITAGLATLATLTAILSVVLGAGGAR